MPNDNDDLEDMSIKQINELFEDTIEIPDEYKLSVQYAPPGKEPSGPRAWC